MRQEVVWVLMLALGLRIGAALGMQTYLERAGRDFLIPGDANGYWELGKKIAQGAPYAVHVPPRRVMRMPGYPAFLALSIRLFGERLLAVRLLQALTGTVGCWFVYLLGRELINARTGLTAAGLAAILPSFVGFGALVLSETLFATALLGSLLLLARLSRLWSMPRSESPADVPPCRAGRVRWGTAAAAGVSIAVAVYVRPSWLLVGPGFCLLHCAFAARRPSRSDLHAGDRVDPGVGARSDSRDARADPPTAGRTASVTTGMSGRLSPADVTSPKSSQTFPCRRSRLQTAVLESVAVFAGLAIALLPWTVRNRAITGHAVVTTLWVGPSLYDGLNPEATGDSDMRFFEHDNLLSVMTEYEMDREYRRRAREFAAGHPARTIRLGVAKLARFWNPWPNADQFRSPWLCAVMGAGFLVVFGGAAAGAWSQRHNLRCLMLAAAPVFYFAAIHAVFVGSLRYRLPAEYPLLILTAEGLIGLQQRLGIHLPGFATCAKAKRGSAAAPDGRPPAAGGVE